MDEFYMQDSRGYVGNDILWWRKNGAGYTTNLSDAEVYSKEEALRMNQSRETDIPWPKAYIDARTRPAVDMQYTNLKEALRGTGIKLKKKSKPRKTRYNCGQCGVFMSEEQFYGGSCSRCGASNYH